MKLLCRLGVILECLDLRLRFSNLDCCGLLAPNFTQTPRVKGKGEGVGIVLGRTWAVTRAQSCQAIEFFHS